MFPAQYLIERVRPVVLNSDKVFNEGCRLIAHYPDWEERVDEFVNNSWELLLKYALRNRSANYSSTVKLTFVSKLIGENIARAINEDERNIKTCLALGDLMLETFLQDGIISITREYEGFKSPYVVNIINLPEGDIKPSLIGTSFEPLAPITGLYSKLTGDPYIKGWTDSVMFREHLGSTHMKALERLRSQGWRLNLPVLEALKDNPPPEAMEVMDREGEIFSLSIHNDYSSGFKRITHLDGTPFLGRKDPKLQKLLSKYFEYQQVIKKAELINDKHFYQEVSCDYRGRFYYAESFLEFQGSDIARSLFLFANPKAVTASGWRWLAIHAAACFNQSYSIDEIKAQGWMEEDYITYLQKEGLDTISVDKMTLNDRVKWVEMNIRFIFESAKRNLVHKDAEKPYSFLACCHELYGFEVASKKGLSYESSLPIPLDGSNNG